MCDVTANTANSHPDSVWLASFWTLVTTSWIWIPPAFSQYRLVPVSMPGNVGHCLASPAYCHLRSALKATHIRGLPANSAAVLSELGCLCISESRADLASPISSAEEPITTALAALASHTGTQLKVLVSPTGHHSHLFPALRNILANHIVATAAQQYKVWSVLRQCTIFEHLPGAMIDVSTDFTIVPTAWEQKLPELRQVVTIKLLPYQTATAHQRQLLQHSGEEPADLVEFLCRHVVSCPAAYNTGGPEALVLQALDAVHPAPLYDLWELEDLYIAGQWHAIDRLVDSRSPVLRRLFTARTGKNIDQHVVASDAFSS